MTLKFCYYSADLKNTVLLSVDGICPLGPNFSHWPGNRTPVHLKHDLSTGIVLRFAALPKRERLNFLANIELVANNHFDTDGLLSVFAALHPEKSLRLANKLSAAAEAGDFSHAPTAQAVKFDYIVQAFANPSLSPIGLELWGLNPAQRHARAYEVLLELMPRLIDQVDEYQELWEQPFARFEESHHWIRSQARIERFPELDFTVIETMRNLDYRAVQSVAQSDRVLLIQHTPKGNYYQFWYAATSWFEIVSVQKPVRKPLAALAELLNKKFPGIEGQWLAADLTNPVAELHFGKPSAEQSPYEPSGQVLPNPCLSAKLVITIKNYLANFTAR